MTRILSFAIREYLADPNVKTSASWCDWVRKTFGEIGRYSRTKFHEFYHFDTPQYVIEGSIVTLIETTQAVDLEILPLPGNDPKKALEKILTSLAERHPNKENVPEIPFVVADGGEVKARMISTKRKENTSSNNSA